VQTDLLARVCAELEQRMAELRPLRDEYERLLAADNALDSFEAAPSDGGPPELPPGPAPRRRRARGRSEIGPRGSAAGAIKLAASAPEPATPEPEPEPEPTPPEPEPTPPAPRAPRAPRILAGMPSLRTQPGLSALPSLSPAPAKPAPDPIEPPPAVPEPTAEVEPEPEPERKPAMPSEVRQAILAALEHGSHTIGELVMVTAMSTPEIRSNLSQLTRQRKVTRVKREGDGKRAFALPASSARG
jgi:hypothetical protein